MLESFCAFRYFSQRGQESFFKEMKCTGTLWNFTKHLRHICAGTLRNLTTYLRRGPPEPCPKPGVETAPDRTVANLG